MSKCVCGCNKIANYGLWVKGHWNRGKKHSKEVNSKKGLKGKLNPFYGKTHSKKMRELISKRVKENVLIGDKHPNWKGGRNINPNGYVRINVAPNKRQYEHRIVMEKKLGRKLKTHEIIHHKDENKHNNLDNNLELTNHSNHKRNHTLGNKGCWPRRGELIHV